MTRTPDRPTDEPHAPTDDANAPTDRSWDDRPPAERPLVERTGPRRAVERVLASYERPTGLRGRLHAVPPHEVYEVTFGGQRAVCKLAAGESAAPRLEGRVLQFLGEHTRVPVPEVLAVGDDHFLARWSDQLPDDPRVDAARSRAMGAGLARLHADAANYVDGPGQLRVDDGTLRPAPDQRWSDTLCALLADCRPSLSALGHADLLEDVLAFVDANRAAYDGVAEPATLLHGNYLPEHVGLHRRPDGSADVACVIDLEHALAGPPAYDVFRTATPTFGPPWRQSEPEHWAAFRAGYESVRRLPADLDDRFATLAPVVGVLYLRALYVQRGPRDPAHAVARHVRDLAEAVLETLARAREVVE